jgi:hypothetical protein
MDRDLEGYLEDIMRASTLYSAKCIASTAMMAMMAMMRGFTFILYDPGDPGQESGAQSDPQKRITIGPHNRIRSTEQFNPLLVWLNLEDGRRVLVSQERYVILQTVLTVHDCRITDFYCPKEG